MTQDPKRLKEQMLMNWPERVWIYSPVRVMFQKFEVATWLALKKPHMRGQALEIGCGLGRGAGLVADMLGYENVVAFDLEEVLVKWAVRLSRRKYSGKITFHVADAQDLPFPDKSFDAVVNFGIIHHVNDWRKAVFEVSRVLRPGGLFYFEEIYPPLYANSLLKRMLRHPVENRFNGPQFLEALDASGLRLAEGVRTDSKYRIVGVAEKIGM